ncbi:putative serine/threonine-protein kinase, active [Septoria linicola]|nr:putative serine/threonine-protein kinase, active [Septoria linicola]
MQKHQIGQTGFWYDNEIGQHNHHHYRRPSWHSWQRQAHHLPRWVKLLLTGLIALCAGVGFLRGCGELHDQAVKQSPTDYHKLRGGRSDIVKASTNPVRYATRIATPETTNDVGDTLVPSLDSWAENSNAIDQRYVFLKSLASGKEGQADLYIDKQNGSTVVVKTFNAIARNHLPLTIAHNFANYTTTWPAEIEASLLLGKHDDHSGYVPVVDYFILQTPSGWTWALVTPFIARGTLAALAADEHGSGIGRTADELDAFYRPTFEAMLDQLRDLHVSGYCHDDVKPDNIFVRHPEHWLLGDLGNVRHINHPWHSTRSWMRQNQWRDCRANDLRRSYKSYLWFLRRSSTDVNQFDTDFWLGEKDWSQMYWQSMESWVSLANSQDLALSHRAQFMLQEATADHASLVSGHVWSRKTERELICTGLPRRLWKWYEHFEFN